MLNRFAYVRNNPLKYIDPSGHYVTDGESETGDDKVYQDKDSDGKCDFHDRDLYSKDEVGMHKVDNGYRKSYRKRSYGRDGYVDLIYNRNRTWTINAYSYDKPVNAITKNWTPGMKALSKPLTGGSLPEGTKVPPPTIQDYKNMGVVVSGTLAAIGGVILAVESFPALMVVAGTPGGQKVIQFSVDYINSTLPGVPTMNWAGFTGVLTGAVYDEYKKNY